MNKFEYTSPRTKELAVKLLGEDAAILAGGTCLLGAMKNDLLRPKRLVNIKEISELKGIHPVDGGDLRIGALATVEDVIECKRIQNLYPAIRQAALGIRSAQIQSVGTVGGDLCQYPRCWYFRSGFGLLAEKDGTSLVLEGDNRLHAILGNDGAAYFVSVSSFAPPLIAFGARVRIFGPSGEREVPVEEFFKIPQKEGEGIHVLKADEMITEILVPPADDKKSATYEIRGGRGADGKYGHTGTCRRGRQSGCCTGETAQPESLQDPTGPRGGQKSDSYCSRNGGISHADGKNQPLGL